MTDCPEQLTFSFHPRKAVVADFHGGLISSDAGLLPIRQLDQRLGWSAAVAGILAEGRQAGKVQHDRPTVLRQRLFALIAGYADANDHTRLRHDAVLQTVAADNAGSLGSQPTLSRFENAVTARQVAEINRLLVAMFIQRLRSGGQRPDRLILDIDATDDPCHGHQQLALFNGFYDQYMYLPNLVFERTTGMLLGVRLQAGNADAARRTIQLLKPIVNALRDAWPDVEILIRADAGYATPRLYRFCEANELEYLIGFKASEPLKQRTQWALDWLTERFERDGEAVCWRGGFGHQAESWKRPRRILYKVEVNDQGTNRRFVVTNCKGTPLKLWPGYNDRGTAETFIDEFKNGLSMDRLSCRRFTANAFRLVLTAVAHNLMRVYRQMLAGTPLEAASVETIRSRLIKVGARVRRTVRRVWVHLAEGFPLRDILAKAHQAILQLHPPPLGG
jgi:hypothetical protein